MFILLIVIIAVLLLALLGLIGLLSVKETNNKEKDTSFLDFVKQSNENFLAFVKTARDDMQAFQIGHNEIVENYEQEFLSKNETIESLRGTVESLIEDRALLMEAWMGHEDDCLPQQTKHEYDEELQELKERMGVHRAKNPG